MKQLIAIALTSLMIFSACGSAEEAPNTTPLKRAQGEIKEVQFITFGDQSSASITKSGRVQSENQVAVAAEIPGRITNLTVQIGDSVRQNQTLATLGNSLSTDAQSVQANTAAELQNLSALQAYYTQIAGNISAQSALLGSENAQNAIDSLYETRENTEELYEIQRENLFYEIDNAELGLDSLQDQIDDLEDQINDLEDQQIEDELEGQIAQMERQLDTLYLTEDQTENRIDQAYLGLDQLEATFANQFNQLDQSIRASEIQYQNALNAIDGAGVQSALQGLGSESQIIQSNQATSLAALNRRAQNIAAPISGRISAINFKNGSQVNPGQPIFIIETSAKIVVTYFNEEDLQYTKNPIFINGEEAKVLSVSPSADARSGQYIVQLAVSDQLSAGQNSEVEITINKNNLIPLNTVNIDGKRYIIKTLTAENRVQYREIETGKIIGNYIEVLDGLEDGDRVIVTTKLFLDENERVKARQQ